MRRIVFLLAFIFAASGLSAQEVMVRVDGKTYYEHTVEAGQTIYSLCKAYSVTEEELAAANPLLSEGLKAGSIILIPVVQKDQDGYKSGKSENNVIKNLFKKKKRDRKRNKEEEPVAVADTVAAPLEEPQIEQVPDINVDIDEKPIVPKVIFSRDNPIRISLILPFNASSSKPSQHFLDFYCGALTALYELEAKEGVNVELNVFDSAVDKDSILNDERLAESSLIIGPADASELKLFAEFAAQREIPIVSPMDSRADSLLLDNPWIFQVPVSAEIQLKNIIANLNLDFNDRLYLFSDSRHPDDPVTLAAKRYLEMYNIDNYTPVSYDILRGRELGQRLTKEWSDRHTYKVIIASENTAFAPDVVRNMKVARRSIPIQIFCCNRIRNFDSIDADSFYELSAKFCAPYFIDYTDQKTKDFILRYRALYTAEPNAYSFQGYDIFTYFISIMTEFGPDFIKAIGNRPMELLQCNFHFDRDNENRGWHNCATRDIVYNEDFTISIMK